MIIEWIMWLKNKGQMDVCMSVCVYTYIYISLWCGLQATSIKW